MSHQSPIERSLEQQLPTERANAAAPIDWIQPELELTIIDLSGGEHR